MKFFYSIIFYCFVLSNTNTLAQSVLIGEILLEDNSPAAGAFVNLYAEDSLNILKYTATNNAGDWVLENIPKGIFVLKTQYLGYQDNWQRIKIESEDSVKVEVKLIVKSMDLIGAEIKGKSIGLAKNGDTIRFNLKHYTNGSEENLGDVLQQLPGLEVEDNGDIKYNGNRISKLFLEGKDILNNQHSLATKGLSAADLESIELIENFQEQKNGFLKEQSDEVAINIDLKKEAIGKIAGNIKVGGGYDKVYEGGTNIFSVHPKMGWTLFSKINNSGTQVLSLMDYLNLQTSFLRMIRQKGFSPSNLETLLPEGVLIPHNLDSNKDKLIAGNLEFSGKKGLTTRITVLGTHFDRKTKSTFSQLYFDNSQTITGQKSETIKTPIFNVKANFQKTFQKLIYAEIDFPVFFRKSNFTQIQNGFFNEEEYQFNNQKSQQIFDWSPQAVVRITPNPTTQIGLEYTINSKYFSSENTINDLDSLFDLSVKKLNQQINLDRFNQVWNITFKQKFDDFFLKIAGNWDKQNENYRLQTEPENFLLFTGNDHFKIDRKSLILGIGFKNDHWKIEPKLTLINYNQSFEENSFTAPQNIYPSLYLRYRFSSLHSLSFFINEMIQDISIQDISSIKRVNDARFISTGMPNWQSITEPFSASFEYANFDLVTNTRIIARMTYEKRKNLISINSLSSDNYIIQQARIIPYQKSIVADISIGKKFNKLPIQLKPQFQFTKINSFSFINNLLTTTNFNYINFKLNLQSDWKINFNYSGEIAYAKQKQSIENLFDSRGFSNLKVAFSISQKWEKWKVKSKIIYQKNFASEANTSQYIWDVALNYTPKNSPLTFELIGKNILNLNSNYFVKNSFQVNYFELERYQNFPGTIICSIQYDF